MINVGNSEGGKLYMVNAKELIARVKLKLSRKDLTKDNDE